MDSKMAEQKHQTVYLGRAMWRGIMSQLRVCAVALTVVSAIALVIASAVRAEAPDADSVPPENFVGVTDVAWRHFEAGCGAITVADSATDDVRFRGLPDPLQRRASRLAVRSDGELMVAKAWHHQMVQVSEWQASSGTWEEGWIDVADSSWFGSAIAISPDDATLLVGGLDSVFRYDMANVTVDGLGPQTGMATITGRRQARYHETAAAAIVTTADSRVAYVLTNDGLAYKLDVPSMRWVGAPLAYPVTHRQRDFRLSRTFATLSPNERMLLINTGSKQGALGQVTLLDTQLWLAKVVDTPGLKETWGVAYNYAGNNRGLVALHGGSEVGVFRVAGDELLPVASARVPAARDEFESDVTGPKDAARFAALAWSGDGTRLIVNRGPLGDGVARYAEWRILELSVDSDPALYRVADFDSCVSTDETIRSVKAGYGQDVVTLQKRPTLTATPLPSATPTTTSTPSSLPTSTQTSTPLPPSATASASPAPSAPPTATPIPLPLYLPLTLRERCNPEYYRSDIALVIDTSSSMQGAKIEDARAAALAFVGMIDLAPGRSQVAVVRYDREAEVVRELTRARATLEAAIRGLHVRSGTHIDKGLRAALEELQSPRHVERNTQVLVLLTDGVQTGTPGEELRAAAEVRAAGVRVYAIGLGADADAQTLRAIAGADVRYYYAPDSGDLARIYGEIAVDLMCPGAWGGK